MSDSDLVREKAIALLDVVVNQVDISDDYTLAWAKPGEQISCTRSVEVWHTLKSATRELAEALKEEEKTEATQ